ncbi:LacI family transcriptional regulator [Vagococcus penaei]|uniref:LacI family transcriptional regulator n=1 Tax=Vagococcus penaei TaxID=633807 RepID=A0A1Q2D5H1_9ENTE|nr:LacI family DNA-binding transcriptional regulator [Vagococcus penaei]AQP53467.1 LacI family transcriptional regulator [Vagococcus penaei]RSU00857.1 LacI family transcriptional regulator [Vagococcus penaei]
MATIKDVAKLADLSVSTVSRYLNNHPYISEEKKKRIQQAMDTLNYVPSSIATQLRSKKGTMIGVLVSRITNPFFAYLVDAIEKQAKSQGYTVLVMQTYDDSESEVKMLELLKQQVLAGIIMCSIEIDAQTVESYAKYGPIILCNENMPHSRLPQVVTDQECAVYDGVTYLIQKGYHKIAYCTGGTLMANGHGKYRTKGFERALVTHNLPFNRDWIFQSVHTIEDGEQVGLKLLALPKHKRPDAVFANSDEVATGIMKAYLAANQRIPDDLAIMGFDDQPFTSILAVPLTTLSQPIAALGEEATKLTIAQIEDVTYQINQEKLVLELIVREST